MEENEMNQSKKLTNSLVALSKYHPVVIEGMGHYDPRDASVVAQNIHSQLERHWSERQQIDKPKLIIIQGDPLSERGNNRQIRLHFVVLPLPCTGKVNIWDRGCVKSPEVARELSLETLFTFPVVCRKLEYEIITGISAITPRVANLLGVCRGLVCLDPDIASYHAPNADRDNVILEVRYSQLTAELEKWRSGIMRELELAVDRSLERKNERRRSLAKPPLKDYFRDFALLQEVTKAACRKRTSYLRRMALCSP